jgi:CrcB protein
MTPVRNFLLVGIGGFVGSAARYYVSTALNSPLTGRLPLGTLLVNLVGCFAIGLVAGVAESRAWISASARLLIVTGVLGGFTTYSAFAYETYSLARFQAVGLAAANVTLHVVLGLSAVWLGARLAVVAIR